MRQIDELLWHLGVVHGSLLAPDLRAQYLDSLASNEQGRDRVWRYAQHLRDTLTELLQEAGRE